MHFRGAASRQAKPWWGPVERLLMQGFGSPWRALAQGRGVMPTRRTERRDGVSTATTLSDVD